MRISIPDELIELARDHPETKREIYGDAVAYLIDHEELKRAGLKKYLDRGTRISDKMKGNQNRCGTSENRPVRSENRCGRTENRCGRSETKSSELAKSTKTDKALTIYNNIELYNIIHDYVLSNINTGNIKYLLSTKGETNYIHSQMLEADKVIKHIGLDNFKAVLAFIKQDDFWDKQILSIAKLNRKNKDGVPYYVVILDKITQYTPKVISIPTV